MAVMEKKELGQAEVKRRELGIEDLIVELDFLEWELGIETLRVTETSNKHGERIYTVSNLQIELVNEGVFCSDDENVLLENYYMLHAFMESSIVKINKINNNGKISFELLFKYGERILLETI